MMETPEARLRAYLDRKAKDTQAEADWIHGYDVTPDGGYVLTVSDIRAVLEELARAKDALKPFAEDAPQWCNFTMNESLVEWFPGCPSTALTVGDLFRARAAYRAVTEGKPNPASDADLGTSV